MTKKIKTYLFICNANIHRSKTAEYECKKLAKEKNIKLNVTSAGMSILAKNPVSQDIACNADLIFVMEKWMKDKLVSAYEINKGKIICFNIEDIYYRDDPTLINILKKLIIPYLEKI